MPAAVREVSFAGSTIPLVSPEHLLVRKVLLDREKDRPDIEALLGSGEVVDLDEVRVWVERLAGPGDERLARLDKPATGG
jgi:hypothetical protein